MTRRAFLQLGGFAAATPFVPTQRIGAPRVELRGNADEVTFYVDGAPTWAIDTQRLAGRSSLRWKQSGDHIAVRLDGARFAGTNISAEIDCDCRRTLLGWHMRLSVGGLSGEANLLHFLRGTTAVAMQGLVDAEVVHIDGTSLRIQSCHASFRHDWELSFEGPSTLITRTAYLDAGGITVHLRDRAAEPLVTPASRRATIIELSRGHSAWQWPWLKRNSVSVDGALRIENQPFDTSALELHEHDDAHVTGVLIAHGREGAFAFERNGARDLAGQTFVLPMRHVRHAVLIGRASEEVALIANLGGAWMDVEGALLRLGDDDDVPSFEMLQEVDGSPPALRVAPRLLEAVVPMDGVVSDAMPPAAPMHVSLAGGASVASASVRTCGPDALELCLPDCCVSVTRPADLLAVCFEFRNLSIRRRPFRKAVLQRCNDDEAYVICHFPPQYIGEEAFPESEQANQAEPGPPPVAARLTRPSRIALRLRPEINEIDYTIESLLSWDDKFVTEAVPPERARHRITPPAPVETALELPYHVVLSPEEGSRWLHSASPVRRGLRTELWHTRLVGTGANETGAHPVRAVWSPDFRSDPQTDCNPTAPANQPFRMSLDERDRHEIVRLSHDIATQPDPVAAHLLILSALGAWADLHGEWPWAPERAALPTEKWTHLMTMGRDQHAVIERRGFLYPFGHKATLVKETERKLHQATTSRGGASVVAYLRQRRYVEVKELTRRYEQWQMPFETVTFTESRTPSLDFLQNGELAGAIPKSDANCNAIASDWGDSAFWPTVRGNVYRFPIMTHDRCGNTVVMQVPVIFVEDRVTVECATPSSPARPTPMEHAAFCDYRRQPQLRTAPLSGQAVGLAPCRRPGDTEVNASSVSFEGRLLTNLPPLTNAPAFEPVVEKVDGRVPALDALRRGGGGEASLALRNPELDSREVFAAILDGNALDASFSDQSDRSGGVGSPTVAVTHLSRRFGPVGLGPKPTAQQAIAPETAPPADAPPADRFNVDRFFGETANILGKIPLSEIVTELLADDVESVPAMLSRLVDWSEGPPELVQSLEWSTTKLQEFPFPDPNSPFFVFTPRGALSLSVHASVLLDGSPPEVTTKGELTDFSLAVRFSDAGVAVDFSRFAFTSGTGQPTRTDLDVQGVRFLGALEFVQRLAEMLSFGDKEGFNVTLHPTGVNVQLPPIIVPTINVGAFSLQNLTITSWCNLPFTTAPIELGIDFSRPERPFLVTVGAFAGGGYFGLTLDSDRGGIRRIAAAFEFGAMKEIRFGSIAHGALYVMGGLYYQQRSFDIDVNGTPQRVSEMTYGAYVRAGGCIEALGLITVSVELYLQLRYTNGDLFGRASLTHSFKIGFVKKSFSISYEERFAGSGGSSVAALRPPAEGPIVLSITADPLDRGGRRAERPEVVTFRDVFTKNEWRTYWQAFAD